MKRLIQLFNKKMNDSWSVQNEYIIACSVFVFSLAVFAVYQGVVFSADNAPTETKQTFAFVTIFPIYCALRLFIMYRSKRIKYFGIITATIDTLLLSGIIYMFSQQYGTPAATLKSPSFSFYFVLIAFHAMRFKPRLILINGALSIICWSVIVLLLKQSTPDITNSYLEYITSGSILIGAEVEKLFALAAYTAALALGASRAAKLHQSQQAAQKKLSSTILREKISQVGLQEEKRTSRLKSEFLDTMSHELRTPLNGILGMVQVLRLSSLNTQQEEMLKVMEKSGDHLTLILNNILDFSLIGDEDMKLKAAAFDLNNVVEKAICKHKDIARNKNVDFIVDIQPLTPRHLIGDEQRLIQILEHLLDNAVKFTHNGRIRLFIHGTQYDDQYQFCFEIHDTGIGMDESHFKDIFKPFHQIDGSITREYGGTGMGLALCQRLVHLMKGEIEVQSISGLGTVFTVSLPLPIAYQNTVTNVSEKTITTVLKSA